MFGNLIFSPVEVNKLLLPDHESLVRRSILTRLGRGV